MTSLPGPIVGADWLVAHLADVYVADVRWYLDGRSGRAAYERGHIPTAVWVDLDHDLSGAPSPAGGRHPLPEPAAFGEALARLGVAADRPVIAYDDAAGSIAARLWWMLRATGRPGAVLDGGIGAWTGPLEVGAGRPRSQAPAGLTAAGLTQARLTQVGVTQLAATQLAADHPATRPVETDGVATRAVGARQSADPSPPTGPLSERWESSLVASTEDVARLVREPGMLVLDARSPARYQGLEEPVDARPGHIPGARNHPWTGSVGDDGRFLAPDLLRERLGALGVTSTTQVIASCGSGVTACHDLLALEVARLPSGSLYPGSWSAWAADPDLPAARGAEPG